MEFAVYLLATVTFCCVILGDLSGLYTQTTKPGEIIERLHDTETKTCKCTVPTFIASNASYSASSRE